jgi:hypothetical protein
VHFLKSFLLHFLKTFLLDSLFFFAYIYFPISLFLDTCFLLVTCSHRFPPCGPFVHCLPTCSPTCLFTSLLIHMFTHHLFALPTHHFLPNYVVYLLFIACLCCLFVACLCHLFVEAIALDSLLVHHMFPSSSLLFALYYPFTCLCK